MKAALYAFVTFVYVFLLTPVIMTAWGSVATSPLLTFPPHGFTLDWYTGISDEFFVALGVSLKVAAATTVLATLVGVPASLAAVRGTFPGRSLINLFCLSPLAVPTLVIGVAGYQFWVRAADAIGTNVTGSIYGVVLGQTAFTIPYVMRAAIAGQANLNPSLEEAALVLGSSPIRTFFRITLPLLAPGITSGAIFAFLMSLDDVPIALFMGGGAATTLPVKIFTSIQFSLDPRVMAIASILMIMSLVLMLVVEAVFGIDRFFGVRKG